MDTIRGRDNENNEASKLGSSTPVSEISTLSMSSFITMNPPPYRDLMSQVVTIHPATQPLMGQGNPIYSQAVIKGRFTGTRPKTGVSLYNLSAPNHELNVLIPPPMTLNNHQYVTQGYPTSQIRWSHDI